MVAATPRAPRPPRNTPGPPIINPKGAKLNDEPSSSEPAQPLQARARSAMLHTVHQARDPNRPRPSAGDHNQLRSTPKPSPRRPPGRRLAPAGRPPPPGPVRARRGGPRAMSSASAAGPARPGPPRAPERLDAKGGSRKRCVPPPPLGGWRPAEEQDAAPAARSGRFSSSGSTPRPCPAPAPGFARRTRRSGRLSLPRCRRRLPDGPRAAQVLLGTCTSQRLTGGR